MKLHILRHAEPELNSFSGKDFDRVLTKRGIHQCELLKKAVAKRIEGTEVWCSGALRTRQTYELLAREIQFDKHTFYDEFHLCSKQIYLQHIWQSNSNNDLMIIGHNFGISDLVNYFTNDSIMLQPGEYICIDFQDLNRQETSQGMGSIVHRFNPG